MRKPGLPAAESLRHDVSALGHDWLYFSGDGVIRANHFHLKKCLIRATDQPKRAGF
jgi:hypothetical protein